MSEQDKAHNAAMKKVQIRHREKMKKKTKPDRGLLLVNTGDGKGKSTAALGTIVRALGWGHRVGIVQFIKGTWKTGEKQFFARFPDLVDLEVMGQGFTWDTQDRAKDIVAAEKAWRRSVEMMSSGDYDLVVLDELNIVLRYDYLREDEVVEGLLARSEKTSVIVTGRDAPGKLLAAADQVTEMMNIRHPFQAGFKAARGIDF